MGKISELLRSYKNESFVSEDQSQLSSDITSAFKAQANTIANNIKPIIEKELSSAFGINATLAYIKVDPNNGLDFDVAPITKIEPAKIFKSFDITSFNKWPIFEKNGLIILATTIYSHVISLSGTTQGFELGRIDFSLDPTTFAVKNVDFQVYKK